MSTFTTGRFAEKAAADYLKAQGFSIVAHNWRTEWCEIDIVACHKGAIYMCEVKYRERTSHGGGIASITPKKLHQMARAADSWAALHNWTGEYQLAALEVSGADFTITAFITDLLAP